MRRVFVILIVLVGISLMISLYLGAAAGGLMAQAEKSANTQSDSTIERSKKCM
jgi:hypothetical protein